MTELDPSSEPEETLAEFGGTPEEESAPKLRTAALRASAWTIGGFGFKQVLRLGSNLILTRLLVPEVFGLMLVVNVVLNGLRMFSELGIGLSIIRDRRGDDPAYLRTAWTLQVLRGAGLCLVASLLAYPLSRIYGEGVFLLLVPVASLGAVVSGFDSTALYTLNRRLALGRLTVLDLGTRGLGDGLKIVVAFFNPTVWALVVGALAESVCRTIGSHFLDRSHRDGFGWDRDALRSLVKFGQWIFLNTALVFLAMNSDKLILGKLLSVKTLGVLSIAIMFTEMPMGLLGQLRVKVIFPAISHWTTLPRAELRGKLLRARRPAILIAALGLAAYVSLGDMVIRFLYRTDYWDAAWMLPILAVGLWPRVLMATIAPALLSVGRPQYHPIGTGARLLVIVVGVPAGYYLGGTVGALIAVALGDLPNYLAITVGLWREHLQGSAQDLAATAVFGVALAATLLVRSHVGLGTPFDQIPWW